MGEKESNGRNEITFADPAAVSDFTRDQTFYKHK